MEIKRSSTVGHQTSASKKDQRKHLYMYINYIIYTYIYIDLYNIRVSEIHKHVCFPGNVIENESTLFETYPLNK